MFISVVDNFLGDFVTHKILNAYLVNCG